MIISQPKTSFLGVVFDGDHDFEGPRSPKAHLDNVNAIDNLSLDGGSTCFRIPFCTFCAAFIREFSHFAFYLKKYKVVPAAELPAAVPPVVADAVPAAVIDTPRTCTRGGASERLSLRYKARPRAVAPAPAAPIDPSRATHEVAILGLPAHARVSQMGTPAHKVQPSPLLYNPDSEGVADGDAGA